MGQEVALSRHTRSFIVLMALLQGGLLHLAQKGTELGWWPFSALGGRICWYTLVLAVPGAMALSVIELRDRRFWQQAALLTAVLIPLVAWATWNATGAPNLVSHQVLAPFGTALVIGLFVALPWLQCRLASGRWRAGYADLFDHAWQNALTLLLAAAFTAVCWAVLYLWGHLFALVKITFFRQLFREDAFIHLATGAMAGFGVLIGRTQHRPVQVARLLLFAMCKGLLPLLAFIALIFVASLPFTGLQPLWQTRSAASVLMTLVALLVIFINAVYQDGSGPAPYPRWLRRMIDAALVILPVYAVLAAVAMALRIHQYGWTTDRFWGAILALVAGLYAFGYAIAALRPRGQWLRLMPRQNQVLSWVVIALALACCSPLLDPFRISVGSQLSRLHDKLPQLDAANLDHLRFDNGRRGYLAVQALQEHPGVRAAPGALALVQHSLERTQRWGDARTAHERERDKLHDVALLQAQIKQVGGTAGPDAGWWQAIATGRLASGDCTIKGTECVLVSQDLDGDGKAELLLCENQNDLRIACDLHEQVDQVWREGGSVDFNLFDHDKRAPMLAALRAGQVHASKQRWPSLRLGQGAPREVVPPARDDEHEHEKQP
ncbi:MAG TPA: DUF4153 domain-containing protein [Stenotrophomonas sp.]|jgi:hypothetical protein